MAIYKYYKFSFIKPSRIDATAIDLARDYAATTLLLHSPLYFIFFNCTLQQACDLVNLKPVSPLLDAIKQREREIGRESVREREGRRERKNVCIFLCV